MTDSSQIAITGAGAICGAGLDVDTIWNAVVSGQSAIAPIEQWDASRWPVRLSAEVRDVDNRTLVEDRKLHKMVSRTDLFGLFAAHQAVEQSGLIPYRDTLADAAKKEFNDRSGIFAGSGGGNYRGNYEFLPAMTTAGGNLRHFGGEFSSWVNPMWLLRHPAEQRRLPRRHSLRIQGHECLRHKPMRQWSGRDGRSSGGPAQ